MRNKKTKRAGGWFDSISFDSTQQQGKSLSQKANEYWSSASNTLSSYNPFKKNENMSSPPPTTYIPPSTATYGGRKRRSTRNKRGGSSMTNFPLTPASYQGAPSINYKLVGGRTRKHRKRGRKTRKH